MQGGRKNKEERPARVAIIEVPRLVTPKQASEILSIPDSTLRYWRMMGIGLPYVKVEGRVRYNAADLAEYVRVNTKQPSVRAAQEANGVRI